jgi:hypothetical protein
VCRVAIEQQGGAFECANCLHHFPSSEALRQHRRDCRWTIRGGFGCSECNSDFLEQATLRKHRRICGRDVEGC